MDLRTLELPLWAAGAPTGAAKVSVSVLAPRDRLKRAGMALAMGIGGAVVFIPIPIVHLILVPGSLLAGIAIALRRLGQSQIFRGASGACPYCGVEQRFTLVGSFRLPKRVYCSSCQRELYLEEGSATIAAPRSPT